MPHDHAVTSPPIRPAADLASPFAASAWLRLTLAAATAGFLWLVVAWALGWW